MISGTKPQLLLKRIIAYCFTVLTMASIFYFSAQPATKSSEASGGITKKIVTKNKNIPPNKVKEFEENIETIIRKIAHFFLYAVLGMCVFASANLTFIKKGSHFVQKNALISLAFCILYAISDELHQIFVPGRSGKITDVLIDTSGSAVGILLIVYIIYLTNKNLTKY